VAGGAGAAVDGVVMSFGGIPAGESSVFPKLTILEPRASTSATEIAPYEHSPVNIVINQKPSWNKEQQAAAYNKAQALSNDPDTKVTIKNNPSTRLTNLRKQFIKQGGVVTKSQDVDHIRDLQLNGTNAQYNLQGLDKSVNRSFGPQIYEQIKNLPDNTRVSKVVINPFLK